MLDPTLTADEVTAWIRLGVDLPKPLTDAVNAYEAVRYVEIDDQPRFDPSDVTADNAEAKIREYAATLALTLNGPGQSPLAEAKRAAVQVSARAVNARAGEAVPEIIEAITPAFDQAVAIFTDAVESLPAELNAEAIVSGGASVLADYETARDAAVVIHRVAGWVSTLTQLPAFAGFEPAGVLKVLAPTDRREVAELFDAGDEYGSDPRVAELGTAYLYAARHGIEFRINTPRESAELLEELESQTVKSTAKFLRF